MTNPLITRKPGPKKVQKIARKIARKIAKSKMKCSVRPTGKVNRPGL